jgi:DNA polymerase beta
MSLKSSKYTIENTANKKLVDEFKRLLEYLKRVFKTAKVDSKDRMINTMKLRKLTDSCKIIAKYPDKITSSKQLKGVKGIGKGTMDRIDEILANGILSEIEDISERDRVKSELIYELDKVFGVGEAVASKLIENHNISSVKELKKLSKDKKIELSDQIKLGLKYYDKMERNIPRKEMKKIEKYLTQKINKIPGLCAVICGSYRRGEETSNDIDVLLVNQKIDGKVMLVNEKPNQLHQVVDKHLAGFLLDQLSMGDTKYMGYCQLDKDHPVRRLDIQYISQGSYHSALLYFTGPAAFNVNIRRIAKQLGYKLNQYGLYQKKNDLMCKMKIRSEKDIFNALQLEYLKPSER